MNVEFGAMLSRVRMPWPFRSAPMALDVALANGTDVTTASITRGEYLSGAVKLTLLSVSVGELGIPGADWGNERSVAVISGPTEPDDPLPASGDCALAIVGNEFDGKGVSVVVAVVLA